MVKKKAGKTAFYFPSLGKIWGKVGVFVVVYKIYNCSVESCKKRLHSISVLLQSLFYCHFSPLKSDMCRHLKKVPVCAVFQEVAGCYGINADVVR